jgi:hypothetical protein
MTISELSPELRTLIDTHLDQIDQALLATELHWSERRSVVGEVETQIFELLSRRGEAITQDDVREVLDSLDPPKSYIPEGAAVTAEPVEPWQAAQQALAGLGKFAVITCVGVSLVVVNGVIIAVMAASEGFIPWAISLGALAWLNIVAMQRYKIWSAHPHGRLFDDARGALASWIMPKNGATV